MNGDELAAETPADELIAYIKVSPLVFKEFARTFSTGVGYNVKGEVTVYSDGEYITGDGQAGNIGNPLTRDEYIFLISRAIEVGLNCHEI